MAGKRQHFMPKFLQQGFASRVKNDATYTWVFRKGTSPFETNIINVGVESQFYNEGEDTEADDLITADEGKFDNLVRDIKDGVASSLSDPQLPKMIAHLEIRTRHLRQNFIRMSDTAGSWLFNLMSSDRDTFADLLKRYCLTLHYEPLILETIDQLKPKFPNLAAESRPVLVDQMRQWIKSEHLEVLKQPVALGSRVQRYKNLAYALLQTNEPLIMGDSLVLFHVDGLQSYRPFLGETDSLNAVYLPLTPEKVLVGAQPGFVPGTADLRKAIVRCSLELFIAAENTASNRRLQEIIGRDAEHITPMEMEAVVRNALESPNREWSIEGDTPTRDFLKSRERNNATAPKGVKRIGRNAPCPCGSGRKYKKCCIAR